MQGLPTSPHPDRIGNYEVVEKLGAGGMGVVYKALDLKLNRTVAIKLVKEENFEASDRDRLLREARAASTLDHTNIGTVYAVEDADGGRLFIVMAFYDGENLAQKIRRGPLVRERVINIACQVARGLQHAHAHGVIHRDIKPSNVIVTADGVAKIVDFGLARRCTPSATTESGGLSGTLPYMSPEQTMGKPVDARSDIWSLGVMLHQMLTGRLPFCGENAADTLLAILDSPPAGIDDLPEELQLIVYRALAKNPDARYQNCSELLHAIEEFAPNDRERTASFSHSKLHNLLRIAAGAARPGHGSSPRPWAAIALLFVVITAIPAILGVRYWREQQKPKIALVVHSIAVLPLANLSGRSDQEYVSENMTEALITELAQIQALNVVSRTSVMQYRDTTKTVPQIAKELQVDAVVEGSVQQAAGRVAVSLKLVDASDHLLRAIRMERELRDILAVQREAARAVVDEVKVTLTHEEQRYLATAPPVDPAAHDAYLMGEYLSHGSHEQRRNAKKYFEKAIAIDGGYAPPYAGLADYYWAMAEIDPREAMPLAKRYALKALEIDPRLAKTHTTLASIYFYADFNWAGADEEYQRALSLYPNYADGHSMYSVFLAAMGRSEESLTHARRYRELDPISARGRTIVGWNLYYGRRYDEAVGECRKTLEMDPNNANAYECIGSAYLAMGKVAEALAACTRAVELAPDAARKVCLGRTYAQTHRPDEARRILTDLLEERKKSYVPACFIAQLHAALGQRIEAFDWLDKAYDERDRYLAWLKVDESFDLLRSDPRFERVLRRVGFSQ
jgi:serine/threonine-protein kinase